jgi:hypothetical protein
MKWRAQPKRGLAYSDCDYQITWCEHPEAKKSWFNAYTPGTKKDPERRCIEASFDLNVCKEACEAHLAKQQMEVAA